MGTTFSQMPSPPPIPELHCARSPLPVSPNPSEGLKVPRGHRHTGWVIPTYLILSYRVMLGILETLERQAPRAARTVGAEGGSQGVRARWGQKEKRSVRQAAGCPMSRRRSGRELIGEGLWGQAMTLMNAAGTRGAPLALFQY